MPLIRSISDRILALDLGRYVTDGLPGDVLEHPAVIASYLGESVAAIERSGAAPTAVKRERPLRAAGR
jgi:hypothetical protein